MNEKSALIVYFSGTGGTKRIAENIQKIFINKRYDVIMQCLDRFQNFTYEEENLEYLQNVDVLLLLYPVYAFDAPEIIYEWIDKLPNCINISTAVISVSGGGEVWPNTSCRIKPIKKLEEKGYYVFYENMMVMPSNCIIKTNDHLSMHLLKAIPLKVNNLVEHITNKKRYRRRAKISIGLVFLLSKLEKKGQRIFSRSFKITDSCTGCSWCVNNCPRNNIKLKDKTPVFEHKCIICLRCIYGCPNNALYTDKFKKFLIEDGFNIQHIEERMKNEELLSIDKCCKGLLWIGVKKYLKEINRS